MIRFSDAPSPNFNARAYPVDMLVLHYTGMKTGDMALARMRDPAAQVSAHYMVWQDGHIDRLVPESLRAWHAGVSNWQGDDDLNSRSIGIEIVNGGHDWPLADGGLPAYPDAQIEAVIALCASILSRHSIPPGRVVGHSDIAPGRKIDPGEHFPWKRLAEAGIGLWPEDAERSGSRTLKPGDTGDAVLYLQTSLADIGYGLKTTAAYDEATRAAVHAFQQRFLPRHLSGVADPPTLGMVQTVAQLYKA